MDPFSIRVFNELPTARKAECVTLGVPFARGELSDAATLRVFTKSGTAAPSQSRAQATWADGSVRWALLHFLGDLKPDGATEFRVSAGEKSASRRTAAKANGAHSSGSGYGAGSSEAAPALKLDASPLRAGFDTGALTFDIDAGTFRGFENVRIRKRTGDGWTAAALPVAGGALYLKDKDGLLCTASWGKVKKFEIIEQGPLVATLSIEGELAHENEQGRAFIEYDLWIQAWAGQATVRTWLTLRNPRATVRRVLGQWPLGSSGSVYFKEAGWRMMPVQDGVVYTTIHGGAIEDPETGGLRPVTPNHAGASAPAPKDGEIYRGPFVQAASLIQDSSGGENWFHRTHVNRQWRIPLSHRGWKVRVDVKEVRQGDRADAWMALGDSRIGLAAGVRHSWQNFPKGLRSVRTASGKAQLEVALWPEEFDDVHELQGGEQKTHEMVFHFYRADGYGAMSKPYSTWPETAEAMTRALHPPQAFAEGRQYARSGAFDHLGFYDDKRAADYERAAQGGVGDPRRNLFTAREKVDEFGWRNFGDVWADNEVGGKILSHYNLEYDMGYAMLLQAVRTLDAKPEFARLWWELGEPALRHEADLDVYHCKTDPHGQGVYNGGKFTHTDHAFEPGRATHRANEEDGIHGDLVWEYHGGPRGGGPESGHFGTRGMFTYGLMSGYAPALKVALEMAGLVVYKVTTGAFAQFNFDRTSGHNLQVLIEAFNLTGDKKYLDAGRIVIEQSHPKIWWSGGFPARHGMVMWMGSIFLKEAARFLEIQENEFGRDDELARSAILTGIELYNAHGWNEELGRFAHGVEPNGAHARYGGEPWWDLKVLEMVAWACRWQSDAATRKLWLTRARRNFDTACAMLAGGRRQPRYHNAKGATVAGGNGPGYLALERMLAPNHKTIAGSRTKAVARQALRKS